MLFNRNALFEVLPRNVIWFTLGRHTGLVPYFFPGIAALAAFAVAWRTRPLYQWLVAGAFLSAGLGLIGYMPFTYSGGGGPVGNRYFLGLYPLLFFVLPQPASLRLAAVALGVGALFTAQLVLNPFYVSFHPAEHVKRGPYRWLPVELSLLNDLPMNVTPRRCRQPLGGHAAVLGVLPRRQRLRRAKGSGSGYEAESQSRTRCCARPCRHARTGRLLRAAPDQARLLRGARRATSRTGSP